MSTKANNTTTSNKEVKEVQTVQTRKAELVKQLDGKINGFDLELLESLELQELQKLSDDIQMINRETGSKVRSNVATEVLKYFIENNLTELPTAQVHDLVRVNNVTNYFNVVGSNEVPTTREAINAFILLKRLVSNNDDNQSERQTKWLKRGKAYTDSHLIGTSNSGSLFKSKASTHYFIEENGTIKLVEKQ